MGSIRQKVIDAYEAEEDSQRGLAKRFKVGLIAVPNCVDSPHTLHPTPRLHEMCSTQVRIANQLGRLVEIRLNPADTLVRHWIQSLSDLLSSEHVAVNLAKT